MSSCLPMSKDAPQEEVYQLMTEPAPQVANGSAKHPPGVVPTEEERQLADFNSLEEALLSISQDPPRVARSTPKGLHIDTSSSSFHDSRHTRHCLYEPKVYDAMLKDSLNVCQLLQHNLDDYIVEVRQHSPQGSQENVEEASNSLANGREETAPIPAKENKIPPPVAPKNPKLNKRKVIRIVNFP